MKKVLKYSEIKEQFSTMLDRGVSIEDLENTLNQIIEEYPADTLKYKKAFFSLIKDIDLKLAIKYGEEILKEEQEPKFMKVLAVRYKRLGLDKKYALYMDKKIPLAEFKKQIQTFIDNEESYFVIERYIQLFINRYIELEEQVNKVVFSKLKDIYTEEVLKYGEAVIEKEEDNYSFMKVLANRYKRVGNITRAEEILSKIV